LSTFTSEPFGTMPDGTAVERWTAASAAGLRVSVLTLGAIVARVDVPARDGPVANVVLGFADLAGYAAHNSPGPHFGGVVGRYANRIAAGRFVLDGTAYELDRNDGPNTLHGGPACLDRHVWAAALDGDGLVLRTTRPAGEGGFPGRLNVEVRYVVAGDELRMELRAVTDAPTVVNLTNHTYFNLAGEGSGSALGQSLQVHASRFVPTDGHGIPLDGAAPVDATPLDFRTAATIGARVREAHPQLAAARGYDHTLLVDGDAGTLRPAARLSDPGSGRTLQIATTEPGLQLYTGNYLDGTLAGTGGGLYRQGDGVALETQHPPDAPNRPQLPSTVLRPGEDRRSVTTWRFTADG
jgi:aldose 1-epimerase